MLLGFLPVAKADTSSTTPAGPHDQQGTITTTVVFTDANGVKWNQTKTENWTLTYVQVTGTTPAVTPVPVPTPTPVTPTPPVVTPATGITGYQSAAGQPVTQVAPGDTLAIIGNGFGAPAAGGNRVQIGGIISIIKAWTNTLITVVVPSGVTTNQPALVQLYAQPASNWVLVASGSGPTVTAGSPAPPSQ